MEQHQPKPPGREDQVAPRLVSALANLIQRSAPHIPSKLQCPRSCIYSGLSILG